MPISRLSFAALALAGLAACQSDPTGPARTSALVSGTPVSVSGGTGSERRFSIEVPEGAGTLQVRLSGGNGDADLVIRHGALPLTSAFDCASETIYTEEECLFDLPAAGTWYIVVYGYDTYSNASLTGTVLSQSGATTLSSGVAVTELAGGASSFRMFSIAVPAGADSIRVNLTADGDVDLYLRRAAFPLLHSYTCASYTDTGTESCGVPLPAAATWYVRVEGWTAFAAGTLTATVYSPAPAP